MCKTVSTYLKFQPDFARLRKCVVEWMLTPLVYGHPTLRIPVVMPLALLTDHAADLVREYERYLQIKMDAEDWTAKRISPPMVRDPATGLHLLDEVWHLHIASPGYAEDIALLTGGHVIEHHAVLTHVAEHRYRETRRRAVALVDAADDRVLGGPGKGKPLTSESAFWCRVWPELPELPDWVSETDSDDQAHCG